MKRIFLLLCSITFNMVYALAGIYTDPNTKVNYDYYGSTATVRGGSYSQSGSPDATGNIEILDSFTVDGTTYSVTGIGDYAFMSNTGITSVVIPESITSIGKNAFYRCTSLSTINIQSLVTSIGQSAFWDCMNLSSISIFCTKARFEKYAFYGCKNLKAVHIADLGAWWGFSFEEDNISKDYYYSNPLYYAMHLYANGEEVKNIRIPEGIERINKCSFYGLQLDTVSIPNSINTIHEYAFSHCSIRHLYYPTNPTHTISVYGNLVSNGFIENAYVANLQWLFGKIKYNKTGEVRGPFCNIKHLYVGDDELTNLVIPEDVHKIDDGLFGELECLQSVVIPDNTLTIIPSNAFNHCINLKSVTIGNSVSSISESAFYNCYNLVSVILPNTIKEIGKYAFYGCI